jgi:queuine/archaeosine tRNA-ribosyltransferase
MLLTAHNLRYYADLMAAMRAAIVTGSLAAFAAGFEAQNDPDPTRAPLTPTRIA